MIPLTDPVSEYEEDFHRHEFYGDEGTHLATIEFDEIEDDKGGLWCEVAVWVRVGSNNDRPLISFEKVNLLTKAGNTGAMLNRLVRTEAGSVNWEQGFTDAVGLTVTAYRTQSSEGDWMEKGVRDGTTPYLLKPFILKSGVTLLFGKHGDGKSMLALRWGVGIATGKGFGGELPEKTGPILYVDIEDAREPHELRMTAMQESLNLSDDEMSRLVWHERVSGNLKDARRRLKRLVRDKGFALVIIDSVGLARGGDVSASEPTIKLFKLFNQLGVPVLALDHVTKEDGKRSSTGNMDHREATPIGSQFTQSSARLAWYIQQLPSTAKLKKVNLYNTKHNHTPKHAPIGMTTKLDWDENHNITSVQHRVDGSAHDEAVREAVLLSKHQQLLLWHFKLQREEERVMPLRLIDMANGSGIARSTVNTYVTDRFSQWWEKQPGQKGYIISAMGMEDAMLYDSWHTEVTVGDEPEAKGEVEDG